MPPSRKTEPGTGANVALPHLPPAVLLSEVLVAFTIEFDNQFEHGPMVLHSEGFPDGG